MISVIIPLYNKENYIKNTIKKVLAQTFQKFEIIIVNDGSTDNSVSIVKTFKDNRIKLIDKENGGVSLARNIGVENAKHDYIAFLDADDEWLPHHLEEIYSLINEYGDVARVFVTNFARKYDDGRVIPNRHKFELAKGIISNYFKIVLKKGVNHTSAVCMSKEAFIKAGGFDVRISRGEDVDLWFRLARRYKVAYSPQVTEYYLQDTENSCDFRLPAPTKIAAYYLCLEDCIGKHDFQVSKRLLIKRTLRYFFLDRNPRDGIKMLQRQYKQLFNFRFFTFL